MGLGKKEIHVCFHCSIVAKSRYTKAFPFLVRLNIAYTSMVQLDQDAIKCKNQVIQFKSISCFQYYSVLSLLIIFLINCWSTLMLYIFPKSLQLSEKDSNLLLSVWEKKWTLSLKSIIIQKWSITCFINMLTIPKACRISVLLLVLSLWIDY